VCVHVCVCVCVCVLLQPGSHVNRVFAACFLYFLLSTYRQAAVLSDSGKMDIVNSFQTVSSSI